MRSFNLKTTLVAVVMMFAALNIVKADDLTDSKKSMHVSINAYVNLIQKGNITNMEKLFAEDAKFNITRNGKIITHNKKEEMAFLTKNKNLQQQCSVVSSVIINTNNYSLVKVSMVYDNFTRENYVTMIKSGNDWKITDVSSDFK